MRHVYCRWLAIAAFALALSAVGPSRLHAQDRPDNQRDHAADHRDDHSADHRDDHVAARPDGNRDDQQLEKYRHDHPRSAARCHDGFFTRTTDRNVACSKHGGVDTWLNR